MYFHSYVTEEETEIQRGPQVKLKPGYTRYETPHFVYGATRQCLSSGKA